MSRLAISALSILFLTACTASNGASISPSDLPPASGARGVPAEAPSIQGTITAIDSSGRIRVEENPADESGSQKAVIRITTDTRILDARGQPTSSDALAVGRPVAAWFTGPVAESYPVQATARVVVIGPDRR